MSTSFIRATALLASVLVGQVLAADANSSNSGPCTKPIEFPVTGKKIEVSELYYGVDYMRVVDNSAGRALIANARQAGLKGNDEAVLAALMADKQAFQAAFKGIDKSLNPAQFLIDLERGYTAGSSLELFMPSVTILVSTNAINVSLGQGMMSALATMVGLYDVASGTYTSIGRVFGMPYSTVDPDFNVNNIFQVAQTIEKQAKWPRSRSSAVKNVTWRGYKADQAIVEIDIASVPPEEQKGELWLHTLVEGKGFADPHASMPKGAKLYTKVYYSHALDPILPEPIRLRLNRLNASGFLVGADLETESGHGVTYRLKRVRTVSVDQGQFIKPPGYPEMSAEAAGKRAMDPAARKAAGC